MQRIVYLSESTPKIDLAYLEDMKPDYIVSYGYRHLIKEPILSAYQGRIINQHISYLPFNRGADPNFWSLFDDTPKGVTIHLVDEGVDTGPILMQREVEFAPDMTLRTSYAFLKDQMDEMWLDFWPKFVAGKIIPKPQQGQGSYHTKKDFLKRMALISHLGWDTPIAEIIEAGLKARSVPQEP